jgi:hypothetical protein
LGSALEAKKLDFKERTKRYVSPYHTGKINQTAKSDSKFIGKDEKNVKIKCQECGKKSDDVVRVTIKKDLPKGKL